MRAAFGLVGILVSVGIILWLVVGPAGPGGTSHLQTTLKQGQRAQEQVREVGGRDGEGKLASESVGVEMVNAGGRDKLMVTSVEAGGALETKYGLKVGDQVVQIGDMPVQGMVTSVDDARAFLHDAYARDWKIRVLRGAAELTLPDASAAQAGQAGTPTPAPADNRGSLRRQLDGITQPR